MLCVGSRCLRGVIYVQNKVDVCAYSYSGNDTAKRICT